jgi:tRNA (cytidine/uridine-2'-O-)-methyltransferase
MFHVILFQPEIPPNTGNIIRLCANTGVTLHLIEPLGFELDEPRLRCCYTSVRYRAGDALLFGPETRGLPREVLDRIDAAHRLRLPMRPNNRSLNLSNTVAAVCFEAWRQNDFLGAAHAPAAAANATPGGAG